MSLPTTTTPPVYKGRHASQQRHKCSRHPSLPFFFSLSLSRLASTAIAILFALLRSQERNFGPRFCFFNFVGYVDLRSSTGGMSQISQIWLQVRPESLKNLESLPCFGDLLESIDKIWRHQNFFPSKYGDFGGFLSSNNPL
jgi:hypothetical protein